MQLYDLQIRFAINVHVFGDLSGFYIEFQAHLSDTKLITEPDWQLRLLCNILLTKWLINKSKRNHKRGPRWEHCGVCGAASMQKLMQASLLCSVCATAVSVKPCPPTPPPSVFIYFFLAQWSNTLWWHVGHPGSIHPYLQHPPISQIGGWDTCWENQSISGRVEEKRGPDQCRDIDTRSHARRDYSELILSYWKD